MKNRKIDINVEFAHHLLTGTISKYALVYSNNSFRLADAIKEI